MDARFSPQPWTRPTTPMTMRRHARFRTTYARTLQKLQDELEKIGATEILFECSFASNQIRLDGWPKANQAPQYNGIAVSFNHPKVGRVEYVTDRYFLWTDNLHAIALTLEALRGVERWGVVASGQQYTGFKALEAGGNGSTGRRGAAVWIAKLLREDPVQQKPIVDTLLGGPAVDQTRLIRDARKHAHPDTGGSQEMFELLQEKLKTLGV
jgi:hypothetical protein